MQRVILIAHSFGARVALKLAHDFPHLVNKMVIADGAGIKARKGIRYYYRFYRHKLLSLLRIPHKSGSKDYRALSPVMKQTFKNIVNKDLTPLLNSINTPVLLIWGDRDRQTPLYMARKMSRLLPDNKLIIFKKAGHFCYLAQHAAFCKAVYYFLLGARL
jgi:pimeloyl-ACP methyl ester carboxylesterase